MLLRYAAKETQNNCIDSLFAVPRIDFTTPDDTGMTPTHSIAEDVHTSTVECLVDRTGNALTTQVTRLLFASCLPFHVTVE